MCGNSATAAGAPFAVKSLFPCWTRKLFAEYVAYAVGRLKGTFAKRHSLLGYICIRQLTAAGQCESNSKWQLWFQFPKISPGSRQRPVFAPASAGTRQTPIFSTLMGRC